MARKIPFEDPQVLTIVRISYVVVQAIVLGTYYYVSSKVSLHVCAQSDQFSNSLHWCRSSKRMIRQCWNMVSSIVLVVCNIVLTNPMINSWTRQSHGNSIILRLRITLAHHLPSTQPVWGTRESGNNYCTRLWSRRDLEAGPWCLHWYTYDGLLAWLPQVCRSSLSSFAWYSLAVRYTQPLFIQALMGLKNLYEAKPVAIHVLGKAAEGDLKRPFKTGGLFGGELLSWVCHIIPQLLILQ